MPNSPLANSVKIAIAGFVLWIVIILMLPETLRARVGSGKLYAESGFILFPPKLSSSLAPESERGPPPPKPTLLGYWRLFSYPPIGIVTFNTAMLYSTYFAIAVQLPTELATRYNWSSAGVGAGFLAVGVAMIVGSMAGGRFSDWRRARAVKASPDNHVDPENRLADQIWGVLVCAGGCVMYGWFVDASLHPAAVLVATFLSESCPPYLSAKPPFFLFFLFCFRVLLVFLQTLRDYRTDVVRP